MLTERGKTFRDALFLRSAEDGRVTRMAQAVVLLSISSALMSILPLLAALCLLPDGYDLVFTVAIIISSLLFALPLINLFTRNPLISAWALCLFMATALTSLALVSGGISSVVMPLFLIPPVWGWFLLGRTGGFVFLTFMVAAIVANVFYADTVNPTLPSIQSGRYGILQSIILTVTIIACSLAGYLADRNERIIHKDLISARDDAKRANMEKSALIAGLAHEIRTPLTGLLGMLELIGRDAIDDDQSEMAAAARASSRNILTLINDLLDMSKLELGELKLFAEPVNIRQLFCDVVREFRHIAEDKALQFNAHAPDHEEWVSADPVRFSQILSNFLSNAIKFTDAGMVSSSLSVSPGSGDRRQIRISVSDTGPGIPDDMMNRIFDRFVQVESTQKAHHSGTGIGLAIVNDLARIQGGRVWAESSVGKGSTFYFETELQRAIAPAITFPIQDSQTQPGQQNTILLADDNAGNQRILTRILERLGYFVITAENGEEALELIKSAPVSLVLMDYNMPVLNGPDALAQIRHLDAPLCDLPVIGLSADHTNASIKRWNDTGVSEILSKPVDFPSLDQAIRRLLQDRQA